MPTFRFAHFANWSLQVMAPYVLLVVGFLILKTRRSQNRFEKVFDIGYDSTILGIGIAAALLGGSEYQHILETNAAYFPMLLGMLIVAMLYALEQSQYSKVTQAKWSVFTATGILGANTALVTWLNERIAFPTVFWGIASFIVPLVICYIIIARLHAPTAPAA